MVKRFCDICGKPAYESHVTVRAPVATPWRGYRVKDGGCDGAWQPTVDVFATFRPRDFKDKPDDSDIDLCVVCIRNLLASLVANLVLPPADNLTKVEAELERQKTAGSNA